MRSYMVRERQLHSIPSILHLSFSQHVQLSGATCATRTCNMCYLSFYVSSLNEQKSRSLYTFRTSPVARRYNLVSTRSGLSFDSPIAETSRRTVDHTNTPTLVLLSGANVISRTSDVAVHTYLRTYGWITIWIAPQRLLLLWRARARRQRENPLLPRGRGMWLSFARCIRRKSLRPSSAPKNGAEQRRRSRSMEGRVLPCAD